jgi:uncharacterized protein (TIGR02147 family)
MINLFNYLDYRKFLKDFQAAAQRNDASFSFRYFAREIGVDSGYITRIIAGKRHISLSLADKIACFLKLDKKQSKYFRLLVQFAKAKTQTEKSRHYEALLSYKKSPAAVLTEKQYGLFDNWYNPAIREMVACFDFTGDFADLGKRLSPPVSEAKARKTIAILCKLGLIKKDENGRYERIEPAWTTDRDIESVAVNKLQIAMLDLAKEAYDRFPRPARDMSTLTMSISHEVYKNMVEELSALRKKFLAMAVNCKEPDRVYHLNLALFPLSTLPKTDGSINGNKIVPGEDR